jgi:hypothetical protein
MSFSSHARGRRVSITVAQMHALAGLVVVGGCVAFATVAWISVGGIARRLAGSLRLAVAGVAVVAAALGLALALRGDNPAEWLHWVYGAVLVLVPMAAGTLLAERSERGRSLGLAVAGTLLVFVAWRAVVTG